MTPAPPNAAGDLFAANLTGALLAVASSAFIGVSFIVKKKGLRRAAAAGARAGARSLSVTGGRKAPPFFSLSLVPWAAHRILRFILFLAIRCSLRDEQLKSQPLS